MADTYIYPSNVKRTSWFHKEDIIEEVVNAGLEEGYLVSRVVSGNAITYYDPNVSSATEKPIGIVVNHSIDSGELANIAVRGTFADDFAVIPFFEESFNGDDNGGAGSAAQTIFTLGRECVEMLEVQVSPITATGTAAESLDFTILTADDYTVDGATLTILDVGNAPGESTETPVNYTLKVKYHAKPILADRAKFEPGILIRFVNTYSANTVN